MTKKIILAIDDEVDSLDLIEDILSESFQVVKAQDGEQGLKAAQAYKPDLILLDITMPKMDGFAVCEKLRTDLNTLHIPIIVVSASGDIDNKVKLLMTGADDFISKPYLPQELLARVRSKIRRIEERSAFEKNAAAQKTDEVEKIVCGNLILDLPRFEVRVDSDKVVLSVLEFELLKCFVVNRNRVLSRDFILEKVWKDDPVSDRTVDTHIVSLRKKLKSFNHQLSTIYGAGYILKND